MNSNCTEDLLLLQCACSISIFWDKDYLIPLRSKIPQNPHQSALYIQWHHLPLQKQPMSQTQWESAFIIFLEAVSVFWDLAEPSEKNKLHFQLWRLVAMEKVDTRDWSPTPPHICIPSGASFFISLPSLHLCQGFLLPVQGSSNQPAKARSCCLQELPLDPAAQALPNNPTGTLPL